MLLRSSIRLFLSITFASAALVASARPAHACSPTFCGEASALPIADIVPSDAGGVFVYPGRSHDWTFDDFALELRLVEVGSSAVVLPVTWSEPASVGPAFRAARVEATLPVGARLELWGRRACENEVSGDPLSEPAMLRAWTIVAPIGAPAGLGTVPPAEVVRGAISIPTTAGSCSENHETTIANVTLELDPSAEAWKSVFRFETLVDGVPYFESTTLPWFGGPVGPVPGGSSYGLAVDKVFTRCGGSTYGVPEGDHSIAFRAHLPDGRVFTSSATTIAFSCDVPSGSVGCSLVAGSRARPDDWFVVLVSLSVTAGALRRRSVVSSRRLAPSES